MADDERAERRRPRGAARLADLTMIVRVPGRPADVRTFTTAPPPRAITAFTAKLVPIETGCVIFTGAISTPDGYGRVTITLPGTSKPVTVSAHRFAFWTHHGALPDEGVLEHHCNEPLCVRIAADVDLGVTGRGCRVR